MIVEVDTRSPVPVYEQIRTQVAAMIASGVLATGTRLPPIRQLATDLGLSVNTTARAYRELEMEGLVSSRVRHGTVVTAGEPMPPAQARELLVEAARSYAVRARQLGIAAAEAVKLVQDELSPNAPGRDHD